MGYGDKSHGNIKFWLLTKSQFYCEFPRVDTTQLKDRHDSMNVHSVFWTCLLLKFVNT